MAVICRAVANVRSNPGTRYELVTQELFGRSVETLAAKRDWALCCLADGYRGWLPQNAMVLKAYVPSHVVITRFAEIRAGNRTAVLAPLGSLLAISGRAGRAARVIFPDGRRGSVSGASIGSLDTLPWHRNRLDYLVRQVLGTPYLWGGKSTFGFDCSGLVQVLFEFLGQSLPRDSKDQAKVGRRIRSIGSLQPYDLLFFETGSAVDHVAVHLGGLRILHASGGVVIESLDASSSGFRPDLLAGFSHARRIIRV